MSNLKTLVVNIESEILTTLKQSGYVLCVAKKVNDSYTVIWQGIEQLLAKNTLQWQPKYQLFGSNSFSSGILVSASTDTQEIQGGQACLLTVDGALESATGSVDSSKPFMMENEYGSIHPGVNIVQPNGDTLPIYVAEGEAIKGSVSLLPKENLRVWFQQDVVTGTMISKVTGNIIDLDFTGVQQHTITFTNDQIWEQNSYNAKELLFLPNGDVDCATAVEGTQFKVKFRPAVKMAKCACLLKFMAQKLTDSNESMIRFDKFNRLVVTFPKSAAVQFIAKNNRLPEYLDDITTTLRTARDRNILPCTQTWTICRSNGNSAFI